MSADIFLYIGSICGACFYIIELYTIRETQLKLWAVENKKDNQAMNYYSIRLRCCNIVYDSSMLAYNQQNNLNAAVAAFSVYLCLDFMIFFTRLYYAYVLQYKIKEPAQIQMMIQESIENPIHL